MVQGYIAQEIAQSAFRFAFGHRLAAAESAVCSVQCAVCSVQQNDRFQPKSSDLKSSVQGTMLRVAPNITIYSHNKCQIWRQ